MRRLLYWLPAVLLMIMIYIFSSKPAEISGQSSMIVTNLLYSTFEAVTGQVKLGADRENVLMKLDHIIRKGAHMTEYALLSLAIAWPLWISKPRLRGTKLAIVAIGITVIYAATDEYHQTLVAGRSGELRDVFIDSIGACIGFIVFSIIVYFCKKSHTNH